MGFEYADDAEGGLPVPDRLGAGLINVGQGDIGVTRRNQPVEKLGGKAEIAVDLGTLVGVRDGSDFSHPDNAIRPAMMPIRLIKT
jgi:hypothetical protein